MIKKLALIFTLAAVAISATACSVKDIPYDEPQKTQEGEQTEGTTLVPSDASENSNDAPVSTFLVEPSDFSQTWQLEGNCDLETGTGLWGYDGDGYVNLNGGNFTSITVDVPSSQHYKITLRICSAATKLELYVGGENTIESLDGNYEVVDGVMAGTFYIDDISYFKDFSLNGVYLQKGENKLTINALSGAAYIDSITLENGKTASSGYYSVSGTPVDKEASASTVRLMNYLSEIYGKHTLTGQFVTPNTNAELYTIYNQTGRFPAIRASDIGIYSELYPIEGENNDIELAIDWAELGGIVSYSWTWYAPDAEHPHYLTDFTDFDISNAYTTTDVSLVGLETVEKLYGEGSINKETYLLIKDMDEIADELKRLREADVTVLFRPLHEASGGWYWWGTDAQGYKWLWQTMVKRFNEFHKLHNIIWVWNGEDIEFYPGDEYVDIISEDIYASQADSSQQRFVNTAYYFSEGKPNAISECGKIPNPDALYRDNAMWLWFCLWRGDYISDENGNFVETYTNKQEADYAYNSRLFISLDELPVLRG